MSAMLGHLGLLLKPGMEPDPYWANVASLMIFDNGWTDKKDGQLWTAELGSPAIEASTGWSGENALRLHDATTDRISRPLSVASNVPLTLEAWGYIYTGTSAGYFNGIFAVDDGFSLTRGVSTTVGSNGTNVALSVIVDGNQGSTNALTPLLERVHIAIVYNAANQWLYYLNGTLVNTQNITGITIAKAYIGQSNTSWTDTTNMEIRAFRATKAIRYAGNFTPPPMPWPTQ